VPDAEPVEYINDSHTRTTCWHFADGAQTQQHIHAYDYVVIPITGGTFHVIDASGSSHDMSQEAGVPYQGVKGTAHNVINTSGRPVSFVEVELKD
jgi:hypothetical protein